MTAIAIDGPAGAGKSTIAKAAAKALGCIYVDTGAMYRAVGLHALRSGVGTKDPAALAGLLSGIKITLGYENGGQRIYLNGEDVSAEIRRPEMGMAASDVSAMPQVRAFLLDLQRDMAKRHSVVMDGRDIGTVVLPEARVKIFLTAAPEERARRRYEEHIAKGEAVSYNKILQDIRGRDAQDENRSTAPLRRAEDAVLLDTTGFELEKSVAAVLQIIRDSMQY
ncbi:MAG: (d)CMP kinase [Oscillospiraceae bacterium]|nr:(d)CMP kinase [Oscillospiraceae bacterium]